MERYYGVIVVENDVVVVENGEKWKRFDEMMRMVCDGMMVLRWSGGREWCGRKRHCSGGLCDKTIG